MRVGKHQQRTRGTHPQRDETLLALRVWVFTRQGKVVFQHGRRFSKRHAMYLQIGGCFYRVSVDFYEFMVCTNVYLSSVEHLKRLYAECGFLSGFIINQAMGRATASIYTQRFCSLSRAYQLVGFGNADRLELMELNRRLRQLHPKIIVRTEQTIANLGGQVWRDPKTDLLTLNDELVISVVLARCHTLVDKYGQSRQRWRIRFDPARFNPDLPDWPSRCWPGAPRTTSACAFCWVISPCSRATTKPP